MATSLGRRYRTETRTRTIPHTIGGKTSDIPEQYDVVIPVPPRDWDHIVLRAVTAVTGLIVAGSVIWSTASIGGLLGRAVVPGIAYGAAAVFDLAWIVCMAVEWLARYDDEKARLPRRAGHAALAVAMVAVGVNGHLTGSLAVGIIGAVISAIAKGVWTVTIRHTAAPLDPRTRSWVQVQLAEAGGRLAVAAAQRQVARAEALATHTVAALEDVGPHPDPDRPSGQPDTVADDVRDAIRIAIATMPGAAPEDITDALAGAGIDVHPDTVRALSGQQDTSSHNVLPIGGNGPGESIADTVRRAVRAGLDKPDAVLAAVRRVHGHDVNPATVERTRRRVAG